jgi:ADP-L-glycero-D-manno-heptose 6-epimerase
MRILITGHKGFIGSHAVRYFSDLFDVVTFEWGEPFPDLDHVRWVLHFGAISSTTAQDVEQVLTQNLDFSTQLLTECLNRNINFQYSSSASVYGSRSDFCEHSPVDPRSPYAWSKYLFERVAKQHTKLADDKGIVIQGFRYFNVFGHGEDHKEQPSAWSLFRRQARQGHITLWTHDPEPARDMVPVEKVIDTHHRFMMIPESGVWNIGTGQVTTFKSVAESVANEFSVPIEQKPIPQKFLDQYQFYTCADLTKINKILGDYDV